jgi:hypothetical protein
VVFAYFVVLGVLIIALTISEFKFSLLSCAFFQSVASCVVGARFCISTFPKFVTKFGALKTPVNRKIIFNVADLPVKFELRV